MHCGVSKTCQSKLLAMISQRTGGGKWKNALVKFLHYMWNNTLKFQSTLDKLKMYIMNSTAATGERENAKDCN